MLRAAVGGRAGARLHGDQQPARAARRNARLACQARSDGAPAVVVSDPHAALERAGELVGPDGVVVATGSIYLIADVLLRPQGGPAGSTL